MLLDKIEKYYEIIVEFQKFSDQKYYIAAESAEAAEQVVRSFKAFSGTVNSKIGSVREVDFDFYLEQRKEIEKRTSELKSFDVVLSVPNEKANGAKVKHFYLRSENAENAKMRVISSLGRKEHVNIGNLILDVIEISYEEFEKRREENAIKFFKVVAKCGHVGELMFYPVNFYVYAKNKSKAIELVKNLPRVKKSKSASAIISISEISKDEFEKGRKEMDENLFLHHNELTEQQQQQLFDLIDQNKQEEVICRKVKRMIENASDDRMEEVFKIKKFKHAKQQYALDGGRHLDRKLKYGKILDVD